jgi:hypothetical protein
MPRCGIPSVAAIGDSPASFDAPTLAPLFVAPPVMPAAPAPLAAPVPVMAAAGHLQAPKVRAPGGAWRIASPALGPAFGGRRADTVAASLAWPRSHVAPLGEPVGHATRAVASVTSPSLAGGGPGERSVRPHTVERDRPSRGPDRPIAARPAARTEPAVSGRDAGRPDRPRRFRVTQHDDEAQFERTMRQFLSGPDEPAGGFDPPA